LDDNLIGDSGACALADLTALTHLSLARNCVGDRGAVVIGRLTRLVTLSLHKNYSAVEIAYEGPGWEHWCDIDQGRIGLPGVYALSQLLTLTSLDLVDSELGDEGACAVSKLTALVELHLDGCGIRTGACALSTLTALNLCLMATWLVIWGLVRAWYIYRLSGIWTYKATSWRTLAHVLLRDSPVCVS
jgi:hypothetical protein